MKKKLLQFDVREINERHIYPFIDLSYVELLQKISIAKKNPQKTVVQDLNQHKYLIDSCIFVDRHILTRSFNKDAAICIPVYIILLSPSHKRCWNAEGETGNFH